MDRAAKRSLASLAPRRRVGPLPRPLPQRIAEPPHGAAAKQPRSPLWLRVGAVGFLYGLQPIAAVAICMGFYPVSLDQNVLAEEAPPTVTDRLDLDRLFTASLKAPPRVAWDSTPTKVSPSRGSVWGERLTVLLSSRPVGVGLRSTLWWVLPVNAAVLWSCWLTVRDRLRQLEEINLVAESGAATYLDEHDRFVIIDAILVTFTYVLTPIMWVEASSNRQRMLKLLEPLMRDFGFLMPSLGPWPRRVAWALLAAALITALLVYCWLFVVAEGRGSSYWHIIAGTFNISHCFYLTLSPSAVFLRLADFAEAVAQELSTEIASGKLNAARLKQFRMTWLDLCTAVEGAVPMPATLLIYMMILVTMSVFFTFQCMRAVMFGMNAGLVLCIATMAFMWNVSGVIICEAAQRATEAVNHRFEHVLRYKLQLNYPLMDATMQREVPAV